MHTHQTVPYVSLQNATARVGNTTVFKDITLCIAPNEHLAVIGKNGSGKSTLLKILQGDLRLPQEQKGSITWGITGIEDPSPLLAKQQARLASPGIQMMYARKKWRVNGLDVVLSGIDNQYLYYGAYTPSEVEAAQKLARLTGKEPLLEKTVHSMSQGELRLIIILRAIIAKPALLLLDEPLDGLSKTIRPQVLAILENIACHGTTIVVTAHRKEDIPSFITSFFHLPEGIKENISLSAPHMRNMLRTAFTESRCQTPLPVAPHQTKYSPPVSTGLCKAFAKEEKLLLAKGILPVNKNSPILFSMRNVDVFVERTQVLFGINWEVKQGENWIVSGDNGSGKSTLIKLLYGEEHAAFGGSITWCEGARPPLPVLHRHVGYVSDNLQNTYGYDLTAKEVVISGLFGSIGLYHAPTKNEIDIAEYWLAYFQLVHTSNKLFHTLSSGTARRILLARAMASSPALLLLDEPCSGLDPQSRNFYLASLNTLAGTPTQLIYVSHHAKETPKAFTHELELQDGRITYCGKKRSQ